MRVIGSAPDRSPKCRRASSAKQRSTQRDTSGCDRGERGPGSPCDGDADGGHREPRSRRDSHQDSHQESLQRSLIATAGSLPTDYPCYKNHRYLCCSADIFLSRRAGLSRGGEGEPACRRGRVEPTPLTWETALKRLARGNTCSSLLSVCCRFSTSCVTPVVTEPSGPPSR